MRSARMAAALTAAMVLLISLPAAAGALPAPANAAATATATAGRFGGGCRINIHVSPREITAGDPVTIFGRLVCARHREAGRAVKLFHRLPGSLGYSYVQSTRTDAHGFYEFNRADGVVETNRSWYVRAMDTRSIAKRINVAAEIDLNGPAEGSQLLTGRTNAVTFSGTESPADAGARVILQRQNATSGTEWRRIDSGRVQPGGVFSILHTFLVPGDANIRVLVRSHGRNVPSASNVLQYEISQAQNPELTIAASGDPILFGQAVTISGALAGGQANRPLTLQARTRGQAWAAVAETVTNATGDYSFPAQSPVNSTFYRVQSAAANVITCLRAPCAPPAAMVVKSAVLFEGVRDVLSAGVSASTVQAGGQADVQRRGGPRPRGERDLPGARKRRGRDLPRGAGGRSGTELHLLDRAACV